jgi:hypothetical protein
MNTESNKELAGILMACALECNYCTTACLGEKEVNMLAGCIKMNIDCADICNLTALLIARGSKQADQFIEQCVEICARCAEECQRHAHHEHCRKCAEFCNICADHCSQRLMNRVM